MREQLRRAGTPRPKVIGVDEISVRKGHEYRIVVSDLEKHRPIWFGGTDRSEQSMDEFYRFLGEKPAQKVRLAVMDMWKPFRNSTLRNAPQAAILFDKFHILRHLGDALDTVRKHEFARVSGKARTCIKGQKYTLLTHPQNLKGPARQNLKLLLGLPEPDWGWDPEVTYKDTEGPRRVTAARRSLRSRPGSPGWPARRSAWSNARAAWAAPRCRRTGRSPS